jgi:hypothetical protein
VKKNREKKSKVVGPRVRRGRPETFSELHRRQLFQKTNLREGILKHSERIMAVRNEDAEGNLLITNEQLGLPEED